MSFTKNEELFADQLDPKYITEIIAAIRTIPGATAVLSGKKKAYFETDNQDFIDYVSQFYTDNERKEDLTQEIDDSIFKVAVYHSGGSELNVYPVLKEFENYDLK
jgi:hydroxymethylpyrimidine pyrophosphatase-like HAD family hydrolase